MPGLDAEKLAPCPSTPNCVCSDDPVSDRRIAPYHLAVPPTRAWGVLRDVVAAMPRTRVVVSNDNYLHVEFRIALFGFIDDVEFHLRPHDGVIAVRSASRVGQYDLGVNRRRVDRIRRRLRERGVVS